MTLSHHSTNSLDIYKKPACFGALVFDNITGKVTPIYAQHTYSGYRRLRTNLFTHDQPGGNPPATVLPLLGVPEQDVSIWSIFSSTQLPAIAIATDFLFRESMRGEGGILVDKNGNEFMNRFSDMGCLAPRDVVARGIHQIMLETGHPCAYLDITFKDPEWLKNRFPTIYNHCLKIGIDITRTPIPVVPAEHYSCGGVGVKLEWSNFASPDYMPLARFPAQAYTVQTVWPPLRSWKALFGAGQPAMMYATFTKIPTISPKFSLGKMELTSSIRP